MTENNVNIEHFRAKLRKFRSSTQTPAVTIRPAHFALSTCFARFTRNKTAVSIENPYFDPCRSLFTLFYFVVHLK